MAPDRQIILLMSGKEAAVTPIDAGLRVEFGAGRGHADFHFRWLRHNCELDRHPSTGERIVCSSELPDDLTARSAAIDKQQTLFSLGQRFSEGADQLVGKNQIWPGFFH